MGVSKQAVNQELARLQQRTARAAVNKQQGKGHAQLGEQSRKQLPSPEQRISEPGSCKLESQCFELRGPVRKQREMQFQKTALQAHKKDCAIQAEDGA
jgi:hypothetical protein